MKKMKRIFSQCCAFIFVYALTPMAFAKTADEVFEPLNSKASELGDAVRIFGWTVAALALMGCGVAAMVHKFPKERLGYVVGGCVILVVGAEAIAWMATTK